MVEYKVSHRYAKSLIELSNEKKILDDVSQDVSFVYDTLEQSRELRVMLDNPIIKHLDKKKVLNVLFADKVNEITKSFINLLCNKSRESLLFSILQEFKKQYNEIKGIQVAELVVTVPLNDQLKQEFENIVKSVSGKQTIQLNTTINPDLIGGFILKIGDRQIDDSVSGKLNDLKRKLVV